MDKNGNRLVIDCPGDIGDMYADQTKVRQALFNLMSNAAKFTDHGTISLTLRREPEDWLTFAVSDTPEAFREWWKRNYGPTIAVYRSLADDPDRTAELDAAFLRMLDETRSGTGWEAEYLLVTAVRT